VAKEEDQEIDILEIGILETDAHDLILEEEVVATETVIDTTQDLMTDTEIVAAPDLEGSKNMFHSSTSEFI
jgi:hypothetical protein